MPPPIHPPLLNPLHPAYSSTHGCCVFPSECLARRSPLPWTPKISCTCTGFRPQQLHRRETLHPRLRLLTPTPAQARTSTKTSCGPTVAHPPAPVRCRAPHYPRRQLLRINNRQPPQPGASTFEAHTHRHRLLQLALGSPNGRILSLTVPHAPEDTSERAHARRRAPHDGPSVHCRCLFSLLPPLPLHSPCAPPRWRAIPPSIRKPQNLAVSAVQDDSKGLGHPKRKGWVTRSKSDLSRSSATIPSKPCAQTRSTFYLPDLCTADASGFPELLPLKSSHLPDKTTRPTAAKLQRALAQKRDDMARLARTGFRRRCIPSRSAHAGQRKIVSAVWREWDVESNNVFLY
ncbi:hypothetical protein C8J57DRAFT_1542470 [Mycena rebaudengoi]|nr:hypothetical protein C8J57DRAFT_1542470 [Mycena rebaudengoi]